MVRNTVTPSRSNERAQLVSERRRRNGVEACGRLIQEQEAGLVQQRPRDGQLLLHPAAPASDRLAAAIPEAERLQQCADAGGTGRADPMRQTRA